MLCSRIPNRQIGFDYRDHLFLSCLQSIQTKTILLLFLQIIPEEFVQRFKGEFPREMILETQNRCIYEIGVAKNNEKLVLTVGWGKFVDTFGLEMGDAIVFRYNGNSQFNVIIFDELGCEKVSSVFVDPSPPPVQERQTSATDTVKSSHFRPQTIQTQPFSIGKGMPMESPRLQMEMDKSCQDNNIVISISSCESSCINLRL